MFKEQARIDAIMRAWPKDALSSARPDQVATKEWAVARALYTVLDRIHVAAAAKAEEYQTQWARYSMIRDATPTATIAEPLPAFVDEVVFGASGFPEREPGYSELVCPRNTYTAPVLKNAPADGTNPWAKNRLPFDTADFYVVFSYGGKKFMRVDD